MMNTLEMLRRYLAGDEVEIMSRAHVEQVIAEIEQLRFDLECTRHAGLDLTEQLRAELAAERDGNSALRAENDALRIRIAVEERRLDCGHHHSLAAQGVESGEITCEFCDIRSQRNDAENMEAELRAELAAEREKRRADELLEDERLGKALARLDALSERHERALIQGAKLREALEPFANLRVTRFMTDGLKYGFRVDAADMRRARTALAETGGGK
jgi:hypothetical protein